MLVTVAECVATDSSPDTWLLPSRIRPTSWKNVVNQFEIIWISRLGLLSFGPAIAGSLLESIFIDPSLDPAIVGSVLLSMCIACIYTIIYVYITLSKTRYTYHIKSQSIRSTQPSCTYIFCLTSF